MQIDVQKVEARRHKLNLTQKQFADLLGLSRSHYNHIISKRKQPSVNVIEKLYFNAQMSLKDIFNLKDRNA